MTTILSRRSLLAGAASAGLAGAVRPLRAAPRPHERFSFLFITDAHIQPELDAAAAAAARSRRRGGLAATSSSRAATTCSTRSA